MTKEEKRHAFFDMLEHPENYSDEQLRDLLGDPELRQDYETLAQAKSAIARNGAKHGGVDVDEEWQRFVKDHRRNNWRKIAAAMTGVVVISGFALAAAVHFTSSPTPPQTKPEQTMVTDTTLRATAQADTSIKVRRDTIDLKPITFEDATLADILTPMAAFYGVKVSVGNSAMLGVRLYFVWDKRKTLRQNIDLLNGFERIKLRVDNNIITAQ